MKVFHACFNRMAEAAVWKSREERLNLKGPRLKRRGEGAGSFGCQNGRPERWQTGRIHGMINAERLLYQLILRASPSRRSAATDGVAHYKRVTHRAVALPWPVHFRIWHKANGKGRGRKSCRFQKKFMPFAKSAAFHRNSWPKGWGHAKPSPRGRAVRRCLIPRNCWHSTIFCSFTG